MCVCTRYIHTTETFYLKSTTLYNERIDLSRFNVCGACVSDFYPSPFDVEPLYSKWTFSVLYNITYHCLLLDFSPTRFDHKTVVSFYYIYSYRVDFIFIPLLKPLCWLLFKSTLSASFTVTFSTYLYPLYLVAFDNEKGYQSAMHSMWCRLCLVQGY